MCTPYRRLDSQDAVTRCRCFEDLIRIRWNLRLNAWTCCCNQPSFTMFLQWFHWPGWNSHYRTISRGFIGAGETISRGWIKSRVGYFNVNPCTMPVLCHQASVPDTGLEQGLWIWDSALSNELEKEQYGTADGTISSGVIYSRTMIYCTEGGLLAGAAQ